MKEKGFSLVELLVVVAIIGVLAGVGVVGYDRYVENTRTKVALQNYETVSRAVSFELVVANNGLNSAINEVQSDGTATGNKINKDTACNNFLFSVKEHFAKFKNPWQPTWEAITVDTVGQAVHRQGQIQLVCYSMFGNFGNGGGCPIGKDACRILVINYLKDRGRWNTTDGLCGGTMAPGTTDLTETKSDCVYIKFFGGNKRATQAAAQADCDNPNPWYIQNNTVSTDAGGRCNGSAGTPCT